MQKTPADFDLIFAFEDFAQQRGWPVERDATDTRYSDAGTQAAWEGFEAAHSEHGRRAVGNQLFAEIKKSSKYAHQADWARRSGEYPFRVRVMAVPDEYVVMGGPGGQYRLSDVNLYVIEDGRKVRIC